MNNAFSFSTIFFTHFNHSFRSTIVSACSNQPTLDMHIHNHQNVLIVKNENERLGMHIKGGLNGQRGNPIDPADEGVFVSKINSSGAARRDGRLKVCTNQQQRKNPPCI